MNFKKMLVLLLTLCMIVSVMAPAAAAVQSSPVSNVKPGENSVSSNKLKDSLINAGEAGGIKTLRDDQSLLIDREDMSFANGKWTATISDGKTIELTKAQLPEDIRELHEAAQQYSADDVVRVFVTMKTLPAVELYSNIDKVPEQITQNMLAQQNALVAAIEEDVLEGDELRVVYQFTYLTNSIVLETEFGNLEAIAAMPGVKKVFLNPVYEPLQTADTVWPATESASGMTNVAEVWQDLGYTGKGMTIAILDTGLDLDHPSFAAAPAGGAWTEAELQEMLDEKDLLVEYAYNYVTGKQITAEDLYYSGKVPFRFNYALGTTNVLHNDGIGDHGTHVAGIAAANQVENTNVVGMAPDAQIIAMKVFSPSGGAGMDAIVAALEDCMKLGVDVANLSLGSARGFSESGEEELDEVFARIKDTDLIVDIAVGNEGTSSTMSAWGYYKQLTDYIENGCVASPSTYANAMGVASAENAYVASPYIVLADGTEFFYSYPYEVMTGELTITMMDLMGAGVLDYVVIDGVGNSEDFYDTDGNSLVEGKVAVVKRGEINFNTKIVNAEYAGAIAVLVWNNVEADIFDGTFYMGVSNADDGSFPNIPAALISLEDGQKMADAETKTLEHATVPGFREDKAYGGQMSTFSSWGTTSDLRLVPDITGIGGNVFSCYDGGAYGVMSGTSMATPQVAGVTALVLQYLRAEFPNATESEIRVLVDALMMSTAVPVIDNDSGVEASPRQQGAGLVNALGAVTANAYLTVAGSERPKAELFDNADGEFSFTFTVHNFSDAEKTYTLRSSLLAEDFVEEYGMYFIAEQDKALDNAAVTFSVDSVTVPAGGTADVTVTIKLTEEDKLWIDTYFPNGNYVEGFVYLESEDEVTLSLPFMGFYGQWDESPLFDTGLWYETELTEYGYIVYNQYPHYLFASLGNTDYDSALGLNAYTGTWLVLDENGNPIGLNYSTDNNVLSPNGDGAMDGITDMYLSLMRNAEEIEIAYTYADGTIFDQRSLWKEGKSMYLSNYGQVVPAIWSWTYDDNWVDFSSLNHGDVIYLTISGVIDYEGAEWDVLLDKMPIYIDTAAPVLDTNSIVQSQDENGKYITITFTEDHPAAVITMNKSGTQIYEYYSDLEITDNGDGSYTVKLDVTDLGEEITVALCDYGCNEAYYDLTYTLSENLPEMDTSALYGYQVYHDGIAYYYGYDYMFGWATIDKTTAETTMLNSDQYEYYAINAAEYVDGYVFAVDAGGNFLYMVPGLWNRNTICNLGVNVVDMAFDEATGTMYLIISDSNSGFYGLASVNLLTGELTQLHGYRSKYDMPYAMTFVDGKLYATKFYYGGLYEVDVAGETYELTAVTDADGSQVVIKGSNGSNVGPNYGQSMTYSKEDGKIYWAYFKYSNWGVSPSDLITIDPSDWTYTSAPMEWTQEFVGLLTLEEKNYTLPESTEAVKVVMTEEQVIMSTGKTHELFAQALPWNLPDTAAALTWSSSNEEVATVDENGVVTSVAEGTATITASCNGLEASCEVIVVDIAGHMNAYKYYEGSGDYGYWVDIDLAAGDEEGIFATPVDFIAADYNGHTGIIYGYDTNGQCYWYDPEAATYGMLGVADSTLSPVDMAYDYSSGLMYVLTLNPQTYMNTLYVLNMSTGALLEVAQTFGMMTLACSTYGILYAIDYAGILYELQLVADDGMGGGGIAPWSSTYAVGDGVTSYAISPVALGVTPVYDVYELYLLQSMCYDHNNDVLLWVNPETSRVYWIDGLYSDDGVFCVDLGDPSGTGQIEYTGTFVVPAQIPELEEMPITNVEAEDMMLLLGGSKPAPVNIYPFNATVQTVASWESSDPEIVSVDENGVVTAHAMGTVTITATVIDIDGNKFTTSFTVAVKKATGSLYAYLMQDMANYNGYCWIEMDDTDPKNYESGAYVEYNGAYMTLYSAEYVDGYIYAYGFDDENWQANFQFLTIDPETWQVVNGVDCGDEFPFVYDMAFDYTTGAMLALAGSQTSTNLYYVNLATGQLVECVLFEEKMFLSLAVDADGTVYAVECSAQEFDWETYSNIYANALMYTVDVETGECEVFLDTGIVANQVGSMTYDYDTGYIYWGSMNTMYQGGLQLIDLEEKAVYSLGTIGASASQITGLISFAEEYPEISEELSKLLITSSLEEIRVNDTVALDTFTLPATAEVELTWTSDNEAVATVDENGVVTGVSEGVAIITATTENGLTASCKVVVHGENGYFITYNVTDGGFSAINRPDPSVVVNLTEGETEPAVTAMEMVNGYIYAYDAEGNLFITCEDDEFVRTYIGNCGIEVDEPYEDVTDDYTDRFEPNFVIRDMAWDEANDRLLAVGVYGVQEYVTYSDGYSYDQYMEYVAGCGLYEVNVKTGALTQLCVVGGEYAAETGVHMLEVTDDGKVFVYSTFMDWVSLLDTETGEVTNIATLQNQGVYGSSDGDLMSMTYDPQTDLIYMLFTQNGKRYQLFTLNVHTGAMSRVGDVGEAIYDEESWSYIADIFAGIVVNEEHVCRFTDEIERQDPTWGQTGYVVYQCICGETEREDLAALEDTLEETVAALEEAIAAGDQELSDEIAAVKAALQELTAAYQAADASLRSELSAQISNANAAMNAAVSQLTANLEQAKKDLADAVAAGDKALEEKIATLNTALEAAIAVSNTSNEAMEAALAEAVAALEAAIAAGDEALAAEIAALKEALAASNAATDAVRADLNKSINEAVAALEAAIAQVQKNLDDVKAELNAKDAELAAKDDALEAKDAELAAQAAQLNKLVTIAIVIASIAACGCVALLVLNIIDKRKKA